ncbi:hypothetical protein [Fluviispira sanaruensis]|uniref:Uncharacterized protein n=1 Tax=Fluviispira sanaruensis TaxID=2493639 RepID=A0A4P2VY35_FLUSA|nr:hypothetical protein [Fluviispira sanaruensis]BBH53962.1 hypothetical protein JCM31447_24150 [Fluviispira sanaruensis]
MVNPTDIKIYKGPIYISEVSEIGTLNNCISSGTGFNNPIGIKIYKS